MATTLKAYIRESIKKYLPIIKSQVSSPPIYINVTNEGSGAYCNDTPYIVQELDGVSAYKKVYLGAYDNGNNVQIETKIKFNVGVNAAVFVSLMQDNNYYMDSFKDCVTNTAPNIDKTLSVHYFREVSANENFEFSLKPTSGAYQYAIIEVIPT